MPCKDEHVPSRPQRQLTTRVQLEAYHEVPVM